MTTTTIDFTDRTTIITLILTSLTFTILLTACNLLYQLNYPNIIPFPWPSPTETTNHEKKKDKETTVVLAGSFNPPHNGHLVMIHYLAMRYKEVIVVIGVNPNKKYPVLGETRADILRKMVDSLGLSTDCHVRIEVVSGYIWRHAMANNAKILFRGIRTWEKDGKEERSLHILNLWGPLVYGPLRWPLPTHYMEGNPKYRLLSSTMIRERCKKIMRNDNGKLDYLLDGLVPKEVKRDVALAYSRS